jgi:hypothetical protein
MKCIVLALLFLVLSAVPSFTDDDCPSACSLVPFITKTPDTVSLGGAGSCKAIITYQTRKCGNTYDVRIKSIQPIGDCSSMSGEELIDFATTMIMFKKPMGFPPYSDTAKTWRIYRAACWYSDTSITAAHKYLPCTDGGCCITTVGALLNNCGGLYFVPMTQAGDTTCTSCGSGSINVCGRNPANRFTKPTDKW